MKNRYNEMQTSRPANNSSQSNVGEVLDHSEVDVVQSEMMPAFGSHDLDESYDPISEFEKLMESNGWLPSTS